MRTLRYFSMFSGIGGFEIGIEKAARAHGVPVECVGYSEIEKNAIKVYERHWPEHVNFGDATTIDPDSIPDFDLLVGGFPCQAFSIAGRQLGFADTRGTLFFDIARILASKRPQHFILENVKNLVSHDNGRTFRVIVQALDELGYLVEWQILNAKDFGVPQNRERIIIVGHLGGLRGRAVLPFAGEGNPHTANGLSAETAVARTLTGGGHSGGNHSGMTILAEDAPLTLELYRQWALGERDEAARKARELVFPFTQKSDNGIQEITKGVPQSQRVYSPAGISMTLRAQTTGGPDSVKVLVGKERVRRLTEVECERLQGFEDGWTEGISSSGRYKACGNAVPTVLIEAVAFRLLEGWE